MATKAPRGFQDLLPDMTPLWQYVEATARHVFELYGYNEIRTPMLEHRDLFYKTTGEDTEIVEKQMFTLEAGSDTLALRPEGTPGVVRAYVEQNLYKTRQFRKFYYIGPMFRYERPQAGRFRQFHQLGVEAVGSSNPMLDVETIQMMAHLFDELGLKSYSIRLNTLGSPESRARMREYLHDQLIEAAPSLCADCRRRLERNVFRVLDCMNESCQSIIRGISMAEGTLSTEDEERFKLVTSRLAEAGVPFVVDRYLVRGLDYYNHEVYEPVSDALGAQDALGGGGRYDKLVAGQGGPDVGATGFALGFERVVIALQADRPDLVKMLTEKGPTVYAVAVGDEARPHCYDMICLLRRAGVSAEMDYEVRGMKAQMRTANKLGCRFALLLGSDEIASGQVSVKDLAKRETAMVSRDVLEKYILERLQTADDK